MKHSFGSAQDKKRKLIWAVVFVVLAVCSVFAVSSATRGFSFRRVWELIRRADPVFIVLAYLGMFGFIVFEGLAVRTLVRSFGQTCSVKNSVALSAADIYFSAITPSATGGQPACAYFMIRSGIPASCTTVSLVFNLALYTVSILAIGLVSVAVFPETFLFFRPLGRVLILIGAAVLVFLALLFVFLAKKQSVIKGAGRFLIRAGSRVRLIRDRENALERFEAWTAEYMSYARQVGAHRSAIAKAFAFNVLQRLGQLAVTMFMYIAVNIRSGLLDASAVIRNGVRLLGAQSLISIGSTFVPVPGGIGIADMMMFDGFRSQMPEADAAALELLSRFVSFYSCVILSFFIVILATILRRKNHDRSL